MVFGLMDLGQKLHLVNCWSNGFWPKASSLGRHNNFTLIWSIVDWPTRLFLYCQLTKWFLAKWFRPKIFIWSIVDWPTRLFLYCQLAKRFLAKWVWAKSFIWSTVDWLTRLFLFCQLAKWFLNKSFTTWPSQQFHNHLVNCWLANKTVSLSSVGQISFGQMGLGQKLHLFNCWLAVRLFLYCHLAKWFLTKRR